MLGVRQGAGGMHTQCAGVLGERELEVCEGSAWVAGIRDIRRDLLVLRRVHQDLECL